MNSRSPFISSNFEAGCPGCPIFGQKLNFCPIFELAVRIFFWKIGQPLFCPNLSDFRTRLSEFFLPFCWSWKVVRFSAIYLLEVVRFSRKIGRIENFPKIRIKYELHGGLAIFTIFGTNFEFWPKFTPEGRFTILGLLFLKVTQETG